MMILIPHSSAGTSRVPFSYLSAFLVVGEVTVSREASRAELFPRVGVLVGLMDMSTKIHLQLMQLTDMNRDVFYMSYRDYPKMVHS